MIRGRPLSASFKHVHEFTKELGHIAFRGDMFINSPPRNATHLLSQRTAWQVIQGHIIRIHPVTAVIVSDWKKLCRFPSDIEGETLHRKASIRLLS